MDTVIIIGIITIALAFHFIPKGVVLRFFLSCAVTSVMFNAFGSLVIAVLFGLAFFTWTIYRRGLKFS